MFLIHKFHLLDLHLSCKQINVILHTGKVIRIMFCNYRTSVILCLEFVLGFGSGWGFSFRDEKCIFCLNLWSCFIVLVDILEGYN